MISGQYDLIRFSDSKWRQSGRQGCKQEVGDVDGGLCVWLIVCDFVGERSEGDQSPGGTLGSL